MRRLLLLFALLLGGAPAAARPALWRVADADTTIWLFGTVHLLPRGHRWRDPALDRAIAGSQSLTLEAVLDQDPGQVARALAALGRSPGLPPLAARVPADRRAKLAAMIGQSGVPAATLDGMESWAAAFVLTAVALREIGDDVSAATGVEAQLTAAFRGAGKPVEGLETAARQLGYFDQLPETAQRAFLVATLDEPAEARADFRRLVAAWSAGDVRALERVFADDPEFTPEVRDLLIRRRNAAWADALAERLRRPGTVFVAVGAGHLIGAQSVQAMLAARGVRAVRVR
jgi:uncharacterized protein